MNKRIELGSFFSTVFFSPKNLGTKTNPKRTIRMNHFLFLFRKRQHSARPTENVQIKGKERPKYEGIELRLSGMNGESMPKTKAAEKATIAILNIIERFLKRSYSLLALSKTSFSSLVRLETPDIFIFSNILSIASCEVS